jgi:hypothetical protein
MNAKGKDCCRASFNALSSTEPLKNKDIEVQLNKQKPYRADAAGVLVPIPTC